jgi:hypothetical protein
LIGTNPNTTGQFLSEERTAWQSRQGDCAAFSEIKLGRGWGALSKVAKEQLALQRDQIGDDHSKLLKYNGAKSFLDELSRLVEHPKNP